MGAIRTVIYAEGPAEIGHPPPMLERSLPGRQLREDEKGPAHLLIRRCVASVSDHPPDSVRFEARLRHRGEFPRGSDLLNEDILRAILTWPDRERAPDLAVVLVDCDGDRNRKSRLDEIARDVPGAVQRIVGMSIQEFEAWLIADIGAVNDVLDGEFEEVERPEVMDPDEAKTIFKQWVHDRAQDANEIEVREDLVRALDLQRVADRCSAFEQFVSELQSAVCVISTS